MRTFSFEIAPADPDVFEGDELKHWAERLFEVFQGDVTPCVRSGVAYLHCDVQADSLEAAITSVLDGLQALSLPVNRLEMDSEEMGLLKAA
ncbi:MAG TPA: hypothetical protein VFG50_06410 [Rhodothermales bacterium]|nr:hypothetical protein [Rhodothermales bacterium]